MSFKFIGNLFFSLVNRFFIQQPTLSALKKIQSLLKARDLFRLHRLLGILQASKTTAWEVSKARNRFMDHHGLIPHPHQGEFWLCSLPASQVECGVLISQTHIYGLVLRNVTLSGPIENILFPHLKMFELHEYKQDFFPFTSVLMTHVERMEFISVNPHAIPLEIHKFSNLSHLHIYFTTIAHLPPTIGLLPRLVCIHLYKTWVSSLPESLTNSPTLRIFMGNCCAFKRIPPVIFTCDQLRKIEFFGNRITSIPEEFCQIQRLRYADFSDNLISNLPIHISRLKYLKQWALDKNQITQVPESWFQEDLVFRISLCFNSWGNFGYLSRYLYKFLIGEFHRIMKELQIVFYFLPTFQHRVAQGEQFDRYDIELIGNHPQRAFALEILHTTPHPQKKQLVQRIVESLKIENGNRIHFLL